MLETRSKKMRKKFGPFLDLCVSSLRRGHANLLCIVPILSDVPEGTISTRCLWYINILGFNDCPMWVFHRYLTQLPPKRQKVKYLSSHSASFHRQSFTVCRGEEDKARLAVVFQSRDFGVFFFFWVGSIKYNRWKK